jgi:hypothetical protein
MTIIKDPRKIFKHYNRFTPFFTEVGVDMVPVYSSNKSEFDEFLLSDTIYEIIKNMWYTTNIKFPVIGSDLSLLSSINQDLLFEYPILEILVELKKREGEITIWEIMKTFYDKFILRKSDIKHIKPHYSVKKEYQLNYFFNPIIITMVDVINYLGDSYYQYAEYNKGYKNDIINNVIANIKYLNTGYNFE